MTDSIDLFARRHGSRLLKKLAEEVEGARRHPDEKAIHDLRVSIRRLSQCLNEFQQFFHPRKTKKTLKRLHRLMTLAAEMRNRDIAIELIGAADPGLVLILGHEREQAKRKLVKALRDWRRGDIS